MKVSKVEIGPGVKLPASHGDIWPLTWADDDALYTAANDSKGYPSGSYGGKHGRNIILMKVEGTPPDHKVRMLNPMEQFGARNEYHDARGSWKSSGILFLDGVLYLAVFHHQYPATTRRYPWWTANDACIVVSRNYGASWSKFEDASFFGKRFCSPSFVQFGRDGEHCPDEFVYAVSPTEERWTNNDRYILGRVSRDEVADPASWTYYTGMASGPATWGTLHEAMPVLEVTGSLRCAPEIMYHPQLKSYLLATFSAPRLPQESDDLKEVDQGHRFTTWHMFQSEYLWGPWTRIYEGPGAGALDYCPRLPCKWIEKSGDSAWIVTGGNPWGFEHGGDHYGFVTAPIKWEQ